MPVLVARDGIPGNTPLVEVPRSLWVTTALVEGLSMGQFLKEKAGVFFADPSLEDYVLALYLVHCRFVKGDRCRHYAYTEVISGVPTHPVALPQSKLHLMLENHFAYYPVVQHQRNLHEEIWRELTQVVFPLNAKLFPPEHFTRVNFDWAVTAVMSHKQPLDQRSGRLTPGALIPFIDLPRTKAGAPYTFGDQAARSLRTIHKPLAKGDEVFVDHGETSALAHYMRFGEIPAILGGTDSATGSLSFDENTEIGRSQLGLLSRLDLGPQVTFFPSGELSEAAHRVFRVLRANTTELLHKVAATGARDTGDDAFEDEVVQLAASTLENALKDRPSPATDEQLLHQLDLSTAAEREIIRLRSRENRIVFATLRSLGTPQRKRLWYGSRNFATGTQDNFDESK